MRTLARHAMAALLCLSVSATSAEAGIIAGLAGYWTFDADATTNWVSGGANAAVLTGTPASGVRPGAPAFAGNALVLDGTRSPTTARDSIQLPFGTGPNAGAGDLGASFTISAWYWQASNPIDRNFVFETGNAVPANYHVSYGTGGANNYTSYIRNTGAGTVVTPYETWHHVLHSFSHDAGQTTLSVYVNGWLQNTTTVSAPLDVPAINVGTFRSATSRFFTGMIDDVALWNRGLTADEAWTIYTRGVSGVPLIAQLAKANNTANLNQAGSWQAGVAPQASDYLVFGAGFAQPGALDTGGPLAVAGLRVTDGTGAIHIQNPAAGHHLELGALGLDMSAAERDLTVENLRLGGDQTWSIAAGRTFTVGGSSDIVSAHTPTKTGLGTLQLNGVAAGGLRVAAGSVAGSASLAAGTSLAVDNPVGTVNVAANLSGAGEVSKSGEGTLLLSGSNTHAGGTNIAQGTVVVASAGALGSGAVTLAGGTLHMDRVPTLSNDIVLAASADENVLRTGLAVDYLVVGGGGGGAGRDVGGGGGAGGVRSNLINPEGTLALTPGAYEVVVGAGGAGGIDTGSANDNHGANGQSSSAFGIVAAGGGGGAGWGTPAAGNGGSGGGGSGITSLAGGSGTAGQGFDGGSGAGSPHYGGAGGGGAGARGRNAEEGRHGGDGIETDITGIPTYFAGGGGGTAHRNNPQGVEHGEGGLGGGGDAGRNAGQAGAPNTGGGGGASRNTGGMGGAGGSGVVIARYLGSPVATGGTISAGTGSAEGYTLHTFTGVGSYLLDVGAIDLDLNVTGTLSGAGGFTWQSPGTLTLSSANTHLGETRIAAGAVALAHPLAVQNSTLNLLGAGASLTAPGTNTYSIGGLAGSGALDAGANVLVVGGNHQSTNYSGNLSAASLTKAGNGILTLHGQNTLGATTIVGGTLVAGSADALGSGPITLAGGTLHVDRVPALANDIVLDAPAGENVLRSGLAVDYLVVGGGGGGAGRDSGGGGGGGGVLSNLVAPGMAPLSLTAGTYDVFVGAGGAGGVDTSRGGNGESSQLASVVALGGGAGGPYNSPAADGASGGGGGREGTAVPGGAGTPGQGFPGGSGSGGANAAVDAGGGGGGAGGPGGDAVRGERGGDGGVGLAVDINGFNAYYGGGGGGTPHRSAPTLLAGDGGIGGGGAGAADTSTRGNAGTPNTGGGGGASRNATSTNGLWTGGDGGSGIVIARYLGNPVATGGTILAGTGSAAGYTLHTFTNTGAHTLQIGPIESDLTISGALTGAGGFTWDSPGTLALTNANTHAGATRVVAGTLALAHTQAVQHSTLDLAGGAATLTVPGQNTYALGGLAGTGPLHAGANALVVGGNNESTHYAGNLSAASLTKAGDGTLTLQGASNLGGTTISGGTLVAASATALGSGAVTLAGGTLEVGHTTTTANDIVLSAPAEENIIRAGHVQVDYLVVGGGGGGAGRDSSGGGGGGGVLSNLVTSGLNPLLASPGNTFDVMVGDGGAGGVNVTLGENGEVSALGSIVALGGGAGAPYLGTAGDGASGGGGGREVVVVGGAGTPGQGFPGGSGSGGASASVDAGGGGGGAGGPGGDAVSGARGGHGGVGLAVDITGADVYYGGGGGGTPHRNTSGTLLGGDGGLGGGGAGLDVRDVAANPGQPNTGGGGGAARSASSDWWTGGAGGSGVVIVRYPGEPLATGGTIVAGTGSAVGYTLHTFTGIGADTLQFANNVPMNATFSGSMTGAGGFTWDSPGVLTLTGTNTYTGNTRIAAGTLALTGNGAIGGSAVIDLHAGAVFDVSGTSGTYALAGGQTLAGNGTVRGDLILESDSLLAPGASIGKLSFEDRLTLRAGAGILWDFDRAGIAGEDHDSMTGSRLLLPEEGPIHLSIFGPGSNLTFGDTFTLFDGDVFDHQGTRFDLGHDLTHLFDIADHSGWWGTWEVSAGSLVLTAVPEPAGWLLLLSALGCGLLVRRRRN